MACTRCGKCASVCPMEAIPGESPDATIHGECIVCRRCESVCPVKAVSFSNKALGRQSGYGAFIPARRQFITAGLAGFGAAAVSLTGLQSLYGKAGPGRVLPARVIRPPGAIPEKEFLALCVRCGECMVACPTNALQPLWGEAGLAGLFSPALTPGRGPCSPECNRCGTTCPTGAIRNLPIEERVWAKTGTAVI